MFDQRHGNEPVERYFRAGFTLEEFTLLNPALFRFFLKNTFLNFCVWERRGFGSPAYIIKKTATAATACIIPKENANCSGVVDIRTKYARATPLPQALIKRRKEQYDQHKKLQTYTIFSEI